MVKKRIALFGCSGSIGKSTLEVVRHLPEELEITALIAHSNVEKIYEQALELSPKLLVLYEEKAAKKLQERVPEIPVLSGREGLCAAASFEEVDFVLLAMSGSEGIFPAEAAIRAKKQIGIANKEILVCAGEWIAGLAKEYGVTLLPVDSEHCALHQCLYKEEPQSVRRLILTASGGALRDKTQEELQRVTLKEALSHPNWSMGKKVTVDCTTLMNKGLEMIEARFLFGVEPKKIEAVIHKESLVHSFVEMVDGSLLAQIAQPDMKLPIQYALTFPQRKIGTLKPFDFLQYPVMHFTPPDLDRFPCLALATEALHQGKSYPCFLNAVNEILVERFLKEEISWSEISSKLEKLLSLHMPEDVLGLDAILSIDCQARRQAQEI